MTDTTDARTLVSTRVFTAPPATLFRAFTDPNRLAQFWGPNGFTNTFHVFEPIPGGAWRFTMHAPDGTAYPNESTFVAVTPPERIVFIHRGPVHRFEMTMTFAPEPAGTRLTWHMQFDTAEAAAAMRPFILAANEQNFDRLEAVLATLG